MSQSVFFEGAGREVAADRCVTFAKRPSMAAGQGAVLYGLTTRDAPPALLKKAQI